MKNQDLTGTVLMYGIEVHKALGPGLLESVYETCLEFELKKAGLKVERQKPLPIIYKDITLDASYRIDLVVEDRLLLELKSVQEILPIHISQTLTYLKLSGIRLGLLMNFNVQFLHTGIKRLINTPQ